MAKHPLDQLRSLLDHFEPEDRTDILALFRQVDAAGEEAVDELGPRLQKPVTPRGMRLIIMEVAYYFPWKTWLPFLQKVLRHEADLEVFEVGCQALGRMPSGLATPALRELYDVRHAQAFQEVVSEALMVSDPQEAFAYHFGRLLEGSANTRVANEAAAQLARVVSIEALPQIQVAVQHQDLLIARHALRLVNLIPHADAAEYVLEVFQESHQESLDDRLLKEAVGLVKGQPATLRQDLAALIATAMEGRDGASTATLVSEGEGFSPAAAGAVMALKRVARGTCEPFLLEAYQLAAEGKPAKLLSLASEAADGMHKRGRRLGFAVDTCAEGLGTMVPKKVVARERVLPLLMEAYREVTGREGVAKVLGELVGPEDTALQNLILACPDATSRGAALEAVGARRAEELLPFLVRASQDPIVDLAQRAMLALGHLAGAPGAVLKMLLSASVDDQRLGMKIASVTRMREAVGRLQELLAGSEREDLVLDAAQSLGAIGDVAAAPALLEQLHSGQSVRVQAGLAQALADLADGETVRALAEKARQLKQVPLSLITVEAFALAHGAPDHPLPAESEGLFREQVLACWNAQDPWPLRMRLVQAFGGIVCRSAELLEDLVALVQGALADKRAHSYWSSEDMASVQQVLKDLTRQFQERKRG